ncbi:energy-coupling factor transporter transmembrane component T family protein [Gulosibacter molinativorax]|uniref:Energy-coupling factor transporter transmembrane protein EcfT n=1 Tax=Gulosibacter molinativorax TaxID=256821 RepID=A0ABT7C7E4_9MICO|nr:energy-coupling factor transporter transmembrane protein EcfT [Gulosibacter molinativorax]MDJ1371126.1 energy-coupling factor transporter transmembrane protein EcfT [Gulosibacter molinativorax]QUY61486.1 ABC-type cobalt transport system, permease protein [Gulosibacter molinativorax]
MISLYRPGRSILHRLPAGWKLIGLAVLALAVSLAGRSWPVLAGAAIVTVLGFLATGFGLGELWRQLYTLRWLVVIMIIPQLIFLGPEDAVINTARVCIVVLLAALVTLTTPTAALLDVVERLVTPMRIFGVSPTKVSLLLTLTITTVPVIAGIFGQLREAMMARGGPRMSFRLVLPLLVAALQHGDQLADALRARGID